MENVTAMTEPEASASGNKRSKASDFTNRLGAIKDFVRSAAVLSLKVIFTVVFFALIAYGLFLVLSGNGPDFPIGNFVIGAIVLVAWVLLGRWFGGYGLLGGLLLATLWWLGGFGWLQKLWGNPSEMLALSFSNQMWLLFTVECIMYLAVKYLSQTENAEGKLSARSWEKFIPAAGMTLLVIFLAYNSGIGSWASAKAIAINEWLEERAVCIETGHCVTNYSDGDTVTGLRPGGTVQVRVYPVKNGEPEGVKVSVPPNYFPYTSKKTRIVKDEGHTFWFTSCTGEPVETDLSLLPIGKQVENSGSC